MPKHQENKVDSVGYLVLGIATYRARVLPRNVSVLLIVGTLANIVLPKLGAIDPSLDPLWVVGFVLFGAAVSFLGYALWSGTTEPRSARESEVRPSAAQLVVNPR